MNPKWTDVLQALSSAVSLVVAVVGFLILRHQIKIVETGIRGETHGGLYQHNFEVMKFIGEHPVVRPYFYDETELNKEDPDYAIIMTTAGIISALFEHVALQRPNLPNEVWESWVRYIKRTYARSPAIRQYYSEHRDWYSKDVLNLLEGVDTQSACNKTSA